MTLQILLTLLVLLLSAFLFITERLSVDLIALIVLSLLVVLGIVTPTEALAGFSNPAVVTVWAVFVLSGGISRTGVANMVGRSMLRMAGHGEARMILVIISMAALLSAFMNNIGVVALLLPVVIDMARQVGRPPSKFLIPLTYGALLGGMTTVIGTPVNILAADALSEFGLVPFQIFDFLPIGLVMVLTGIVFFTLVGRHLLPADSAPDGKANGHSALQRAYGMHTHLFSMRIPEGSSLVNQTIYQSRLGDALGMTIVRIQRANGVLFVPSSTTRLREGDELMMVGKRERLDEIKGHTYLDLEEEDLQLRSLVTENIHLIEASISPHSEMIGKTLRQLQIRQRYGILVLAIWRGGLAIRTSFDNLPIEVGDAFLIQATKDQIDTIRNIPDFFISTRAPADEYRLEERLWVVRVPEDSALAGKTIAECRLPEMVGTTILGLVRGEVTTMMIDPNERLLVGDKLLVKGKTEERLETLKGLQGLSLEPANTTLVDLENEHAGVMEAVLSPRTRLVGHTLRDISFRGRYNLNVLAIMREGEPIIGDLADEPLRFGDAFLLHGARDRLRLLASDPDFVVLSEEVQPAPREKKAVLAIAIMVGVIVSVLSGWLPIAIAAVIGATMMVLTGCLRMTEAYHDIEWRAVFLIAGMLPLGTAMASSGAAELLAQTVISLVGGLGIIPMVTGLFLLTMIASQIMPNPVVTVLMAPIAITTARTLGLSPYAIMMVIAIAASSSFLTPVGHPVNILIMGPGGYRFKDYFKVGLPLTILILLAVLFVLPIFLPF